jgi:hypothetical protein
LYHWYQKFLTGLFSLVVSYLPFNSALKRLCITFSLFYLFFFLVKEKEDLHPDPEVQSVKDETFGEYR